MSIITTEKQTTVVVEQTSNQSVVITQQPAELVVVGGQQGIPGATGPQGPAGPQGVPGPQGPAGSSITFVYNQLSASSTWQVEHNMQKYPSVTVLDSAGDEVEGNVAYVDQNNLTISFSAPFIGVAYLN